MKKICLQTGYEEPDRRYKFFGYVDAWTKLSDFKYVTSATINYFIVLNKNKRHNKI